MNIIEEAYDLLLLERQVNVKRTDVKSINREDVSNFLYKITDGGREMFSVWTIRKHDSRTEPHKKTGNTMKLTGRLGTCKLSFNKNAIRRPELATPIQYKKNDILRMCVTSIDNKNYNYLPIAKRTRSFDVTNISKISAGGTEYLVK